MRLENCKDTLPNEVWLADVEPSIMFESADVERTKQLFADGGKRYDWKLVHPTRLGIGMRSQKDSVETNTPRSDLISRKFMLVASSLATSLLRLDSEIGFSTCTALEAER